jgi:hypothetical protein
VRTRVNNIVEVFISRAQQKKRQRTLISDLQKRANLSGWMGLFFHGLSRFILEDCLGDRPSQTSYRDAGLRRAASATWLEAAPPATARLCSRNSSTWNWPWSTKIAQPSGPTCSGNFRHGESGFATKWPTKPAGPRALAKKENWSTCHEKLAGNLTCGSFGKTVNNPHGQNKII